MGQPMHAFDADEIGGRKIIVRRAENGEKITTLDEKEFALSENNLVICDGTKPVALAGIMGGLNSEIKDTTKDVIFESAKFARDSVRKTARALGQSSDSSSISVALSRSIIFSKAVLSIEGKALPRRSARLKIPSQAFALK